MKQKLKNLIHSLRIAEPLPPCELKGRQLTSFFDDVSKLGLVSEPGKTLIIADHIIGHVRFRQFMYNNNSEGINILVVYLTGSGSDEVLIINAEFSED